MKLGEVVTTIPTIGFNVETVTHNGVNFTIWDVGGCDKIRPLWRHYFQNTQLAVFIVDSTDRDRIDEAAEEFYRLKSEQELLATEFLIFANKQDLSNVMTADDIATKFKVSRDMVFPCCAVTGDGLNEAFDYAVRVLTTKPKATVEAKSETKKKATDPMEDLLHSWLEKEDESDDQFLHKFHDYTLDTWDHRTHLRIAWIYLTKYSRKEAFGYVFDGIKDFIENSPRTQRKKDGRGTTFHMTMTYFWFHMVHFAIVSTKSPKNDFKTFLLLNPQLVNGGLFLHYYSKQRMLLDPEARSTMLLPDKISLPSITGTAAGTMTDKKLLTQPREPLTDAEFLEHFNNSLINSTTGDKLTGWGHESKLRLIYLVLLQNGVTTQTSVTNVLNVLQEFEKSAYHVTINYFWVTMLRYQLMATIKEKGITFTDQSNVAFSDFLRQPTCQPLRNQLLYEKYFTRGRIDQGETEFTVPDIKQLPSLVV